MDDDGRELFDGAAVLLTDVVRSHTRALPAAEIRRRGRVRRRSRTAAVAGTAVLALLVAGGAHATGLGAARPTVQQPADGSGRGVQVLPGAEDLMPAEQWHGLVDGRTWSLSGPAAKAPGRGSGTYNCRAADDHFDDGGRPVIGFYDDGHAGLSEMVSHYDFRAAALFAFRELATSLAECAGTTWSPPTLGDTDTDSAHFVIVERGQGTPLDPTRVNHVSVRRQGTVLVVLNKREPVTGPVPASGASDPLARAMAAAMKLAYP